MSVAAGCEMAFVVLSQKVYDQREPRENVPPRSLLDTGADKVVMDDEQVSWYGE